MILNLNNLQISLPVLIAAFYFIKMMKRMRDAQALSVQPARVAERN